MTQSSVKVGMVCAFGRECGSSPGILCQKRKTLFVRARSNYYIGVSKHVATHAGRISVYYAYALIASG